MTLILFMGLYMAGLVATLLNPIWGAATYVWVYHINPHGHWWSEPINAVGLRSSFTVAAFLALSILIYRPTLARNAQQFSLGIMGLLLFAFWTLTTTLWSDSPDRATMLADKAIKMSLFALMLVRCVNCARNYQILVMVWVASVGYLGYLAYTGQGGVERSRLTRGVGGPDFSDSNMLAAHLVATLPLMLALFFSLKNWFARIGVAGIALLCFNTIVMTRSRGAFVGLAVMLLVAMFSLPRGYRWRGFLIVMVAILGCVQLADPGWWTRMATITAHADDAAVTDRLLFWNAALRMGYEHPFGIGIGAFQERIVQEVAEINVVRAAHNAYLETFAELGWPGLVRLLTVAAATLYQLTRMGAMKHPPCEAVFRNRPWAADVHLAWCAVGLRAALVGYGVCAVFITVTYCETIWLLIAMAASLKNVGAQMQANAERDREVIPAPQSPPAPELRPPRYAPAPHARAFRR